jgi:hypothetical protein
LKTYGKFSPEIRPLNVVPRLIGYTVASPDG